MLPQIIKQDKRISKKSKPDDSVSTELAINYNKSTYDKQDNVVSINIDRAAKGKGIVSNVKTYTQNTVKKFELTGNKEVCIRKIMIAERKDNFFDVTVRELKIYYRKSFKHKFNKVLRFKTALGNIEHVFELLKNQEFQKNEQAHITYLLN